MTVKELIEKLSQYPPDMEVRAGEYYLGKFKVIDAYECREKVKEPFVGLELD